MIEQMRFDSTEARSSNRSSPAATKTAMRTLNGRALTLEQARPLWATFPESDLFGVAQMLPWVSTWADCVNPDAVVGALFDGDVAVLLLPLEILNHKGTRIARYVGGTHAHAKT